MHTLKSLKEEQNFVDVVDERLKVLIVLQVKIGRIRHVGILLVELAREPV
jgi:hypothetical protein